MVSSLCKPNQLHILKRKYTPLQHPSQSPLPSAPSSTSSSISPTQSQSSPSSSASSESIKPSSEELQHYAEQNYEHTQQYQHPTPQPPHPTAHPPPLSHQPPTPSPPPSSSSPSSVSPPPSTPHPTSSPPLSTPPLYADKFAGIPRTYERFNHEIHVILQNEGIEKALEAKINAKCRDLLRVPMINTHDIFANSELRLTDIDVIGFDYDYTLAQYTNQIQNEIYSMAVNVLVHELKYPSLLHDYCTYDPNFAIRGLHYDMEKGYLMKLDYLLNIQLGAIYFGRRLVGKEEAIMAYGSLQLRESYANTNLRLMSDIFCLPETCLISDVINFLTKTNSTFEPHIIYEDVTRAVNMIHKNGSLHRTIVRDIHKYLDSNPALGVFLTKLKNSNKKTFMLTNSPYNFADAGMQYMLRDSMPPEVKHWTEMFDVVLTQCDKPNFFGRGRSFRIQDPDSGKNFWHKINKFEPGAVYVGGSLAEFTSITQWKGNRVLYFGDHLFSDLMEPSIREGWRTGVIIKELEKEVEIQNSPEYRSGLSELMATEEMIYKCQYYHGRDRDTILRLLKNRRFDLRLGLKEVFNKYFGSVFRTHNNPTMFTHSLQQYADLYTCKIENFSDSPLDFSFYPARNFLPHEFKLN